MALEDESTSKPSGIAVSGPFPKFALVVLDGHAVVVLVGDLDLHTAYLVPPTQHPYRNGPVMIVLGFSGLPFFCSTEILIGALRADFRNRHVAQG
jgi:hypothetical protein